MIHGPLQGHFENAGSDVLNHLARSAGTPPGREGISAVVARTIHVTEIARASPAMPKDCGRANRGSKGRLASRAARSGCVISCGGESGCASGALAPNFATSFTSSTTGHAFSSGVGEDTIYAERNGAIGALSGPKS